MKARHTPKPVYVCVLLALSAQPAFANPLNPTVVNGQASFASTGNALTVTNTPGAIINWQGFSIGASEITRFNQQSAESSVLNRVISNNPSSILGALQSNGRVFLINPNGIVFGAGAMVDVAGLVASTLNLSNADFLAGRHSYTSVPGVANISNAGNITAKGDGQTGGQIYLIAPNVENTGVITAPNGEILLAAGYSVDLVNTSNPNLRVSITAPAGDATNVGQLVASTGSLGLFGTVVRNSGQVSANSATMQAGRIVFKASQRVEAGGMISAQGAGGGNIAVLADMQAGIVNVTGTLDASAPNSGNGGFIETSAAHVQIANTAAVSTFSRNGTSGTWLIDPLDFYIAATGGSITGATVSSSLAAGNVTIANATGTGNGDIAVNDPVGWASANSLMLFADRNISIGAALTGTRGSLILSALTGTITNSGAGLISVNNLQVASYGSVSITGFNQINTVTANVTGPGSTFTLENASSNLTVGTSGPGTSGPGVTSEVAANGVTANGAVSINSSGALTTNGLIASATSDVSLAARNGITQNADITAFGNVTLTANANEGMGNFVQTKGFIANTGVNVPGNITINAYDIQVGAINSRRNVLLNAANDIRILNAGFIGGGTAQNFHVDDASFAYTLPFDFTYYGVPYTTLYVSVNGVITFGAGSYYYSSSTAGFKSGVQTLPTISPAWSDWITYAPGDIYIHQPGANTLAVRWDVANYANHSYTADFEAVLAQQGSITFNYSAATAMSPGYSAIIGVSRGDNLHYTISALNNPASLNNLSSALFSYNAATGNYIETLLGAGGSGGTLSGGAFNNITAASDVSLIAAGAININNPIMANTINAHSGSGIILGGALSAGESGNVLDAGTLQSLTLNNTGNFNLTQGLAATQSISLSSGGAIVNAAPTGSTNLSAPSVQLTAVTGIGSATVPLQLATSSLNANTSTGGGSLFNTPNDPVTLVNFTTADASPLSYSQAGQALTLTGIMSSLGGSLLIDPPTDLAMNAGSGMSSGGGAIGLLASGNILLSNLNAGSGAVNITTTGGMIGSSLPAGQSNITAGSVTASAVTGAQFSFYAPIANISSTGGIVLVNNLLTGATISNALPVEPIAPIASPSVVSSVVSNIISIPIFDDLTHAPVLGDTQMSLTSSVNLALSASAPGAGLDDTEEPKTTTNSKRNQAEQEAATIEATAEAPVADAARPLPICR